MQGLLARGERRKHEADAERDRGNDLGEVAQQRAQEIEAAAVDIAHHQAQGHLAERAAARRAFQNRPVEERDQHPDPVQQVLHLLPAQAVGGHHHGDDRLVVERALVRKGFDRAAGAEGVDEEVVARQTPLELDPELPGGTHLTIQLDDIDAQLLV